MGLARKTYDLQMAVQCEEISPLWLVILPLNNYLLENLLHLKGSECSPERLRRLLKIFGPNVEQR